MRLGLTALCLGLALTNATYAQSDDFNPYQATLDAMALEQAEPLIEAAYGPIENRYSGIAQPYEDGPVLVLMAGSAMFLFCEEQLAAFTAPLKPTTAAQILRPLTRPGADTTVYAADDGIAFFAVDDTLTVIYSGVGTKTSSVTATYPRKLVLSLDFAKHCEDLAGQRAPSP